MTFLLVRLVVKSELNQLFLRKKRLLVLEKSAEIVKRYRPKVKGRCQLKLIVSVSIKTAVNRGKIK